MRLLKVSIFTLLLLLSIQDVNSQRREAKQHNGGAKISVSDLSINFKEVRRKETPPSQTIYIRNDGTQPLVITNTATSCRCIKSRYPKQPISPNDSIPFKISYHALRGEIGHFHKVLRIYSTSSESPCVMVTIQGEVKSDD